LASRKTSITRIAQWLLAAVVIGFAARAVAHQWQDVAPALGSLRIRWSRVLASGIIVLATYALLIEAWRSTLRAWNEQLPYGTAARIWFVSNLGKYVPGKIWQIAAMGAMAQRSGVSATAAIGSALVVNLVSIIAGAAVIVATAGRRVALVVGAEPGDGGRTSVLMASAVVIVGVAALALTPAIVPRLAGLAARLTGRNVTVPSVPPRAIWLAAAATAASWVFYGVAFELFANGITPRAAGNATSYIAVYTGSYLAGYLALFVPGGVGVREAAIVIAMPQFQLASAADAAIIAITSRLWLTVLEILPGLLLMRRADRDERQLVQDTRDVE
jgi:glycosyltransferase 2 family protein